MSTLLSKLLSFCLSLSPECSTAVLSCTCPDRLGECHSNFEHTRNTNSLHHRHICVVLQDVFASREKISKSVRLYLYICIFCFLLFPFFGRSRCCWHEHIHWSKEGCLWVSRSTLPPVIITPSLFLWLHTLLLEDEYNPHYMHVILCCMS